MQAFLAWKKLYTKEHLEEHYHEKVETNPSIGLDKITPMKFKSELNSNIEIILRKINNGSYHFTRYKQLLFTKGPGKPPRAVCIPTLRDKLTVSTLNELLGMVYGDECKTQLPHLIISEIIQKMDLYDCFLKLDIKSFYASINQKTLLSKLKRRIRKTEICNLINSTIQTSAISYPIKEKVVTSIREKGVPEGLAISNALANIYMLDIDKKYRINNKIGYWRYVDDILIFANKDDFDNIKAKIELDIKNIGLEINEKKAEGFIINGFDYLGYKVNTEYISVRQSSVFKLEQSLEELFRKFREKDLKYLEWKLNLKITGFILEKHKYGWLFFYSQITDLKLLYHLDDLIAKFIKRYGLENKLHIKRFIRTYFEIRQALHVTNYIPNIDKYNLNDKRSLLSDIYQMDLTDISDDKVEYKFRQIMSREIRDIEKDVQDIS